MIDIKNTKSHWLKEEYRLFINGMCMNTAKVEVYGKDYYSFLMPEERQANLHWGIRIRDFPTYELLATHRFSELPQLKYLELKLKFDWSDLIDHIWISPPTDKPHRENFEASFNFKYSLPDWKKPFSFAEYIKEFSRAFEEKNYSNISLALYEDIEDYSFAVKFLVTSPDLLIADELMQYSNLIHGLCDEVGRSLISRVNSESVVMFFDFPEEMKVPCEQYLLYFVQFLRDLGVEASSELKHDVGQVLFTVTPTDTRQALDKIRTALEIYLHLPASPVSDIIDNEIAIQRLASNILHLKGQLSLARAELQAKDAAIQFQQLTIAHQQHLLSDAIMVDSLKDATPKSKDKEELLGGTFAITKYEGKGFEIDFAKIFRRLRQYLAREE